jgi:ABC-type multidrug transport system fused ATPase/permease subunit
MGHHFRQMVEMAEDEGHERTMSDRALLTRILGCVMVYRRRFIVTVALVVASAAIGIVMPYVWKVAIDGYIIPFGDGSLDGEALMRGLAWLGAAYILLTVGSYAVETLKRYLLEYIGQSVM